MNIEELHIDCWITKIDNSFLNKNGKIRTIKVESIKKTKDPNNFIINGHNLSLSTIKIITEEESDIITGIKKFRKDLIGKWIKKKNNTLFGSGINLRPVIYIEDIKSSYDYLKLVVNDIYTIDLLLIDILTEEESLSIIDFFNNCTISESREMPIEESCFVRSTGLPKEKLSERSIQKVLYEMRMKNPEKRYEGYNCKYCNSFHIGSTSHLEIN